MIIEFTQEDIEKCERFANEINTDYYASRGQLNANKRIKDNIVGKLGELAAQKYFLNQGIEVSEPDFAIYGKSKKSWDYDLKGKEFNLHCKSQNVAQGLRYGVSWIFEKSDRHIFKTVQENDYVCFISVNLDNRCAEIKSIINLNELHEKQLFKKPKLDYLITKSAVYFDDLEKVFQDRIFDGFC